MSTALAIQEPQRTALLRPIAEPAAVVEAQNATRRMVHEALVEGRDFGVVPGTDKPTMLKPGAERVALGFGCYYGTPEIIEREIDHDRLIHWSKSKWAVCPKPENWAELKERGVGRNRKLDEKWVWQEKQDTAGVSQGLYRYVVRVPVINRATGEIVGSGIGSCSSMEAKYIEAPRDVENTILKMAFKRAMVAACLTTFGLSDEFTQDVEDLAENKGESAPPQSHPEREERQPDPAPVHDVAWALNYPFPFRRGSDLHNRPLAGLPTQLLKSVKGWIESKRSESSDPAWNAESYDAISMVLAFREAERETVAKEQVTMDLGSPAAAPVSAPASAAPTDSKLAPGRVQDAYLPAHGDAEGVARPAETAGVATAVADPPPMTIGALSRRISELLQHEKFTADERQEFRAKLDKAESLVSMQALVADLETFIAQPF